MRLSVMVTIVNAVPSPVSSTIASSAMMRATPRSSASHVRSVLDIGWARGFGLWALDVSARQVQIARRHVEVHLEIGDVPAAGHGRTSLRKQSSCRTAHRAEGSLNAKGD